MGERNESERDEVRGAGGKGRREEKRPKLGMAFQDPISSSSLCQDQGQHQDCSMDKRACKHPLAASTVQTPRCGSNCISSIIGKMTRVMRMCIVVVCFRKNR